MKKIIYVFFACIVTFCVTSYENTFAESSSIVETRNKVSITNISQAPYSNIVNIISQFSDGQTSGSGFFINDHIIVTAAHCVYDADKKEYAKSVSVYVPTKNNTWGGPYKIDQIEVNPRYVSWTVDNIDLSGSLTQDYAALILNAPLDKDVYPNYWVNFFLSNQSLTVGEDLNLAGVLPKGNGREMYQLTGNLLRSNNQTMIYNLETGPGLSGAPVYRAEKGGIYEVLGIHNAAYGPNNENGGVKINEKVYNWYMGIVDKKYQPSILDGGYAICPLSSSDKALTVPNNESSEHVYQYTYADSPNWENYQYWTIVHVGNGKYKITNNKSGKVLEVARGDMAKETPIIQFPYTGQDEQLWRISLVRTISDGWLKQYECVITNVKTGQVLDISDNSTSNYTEAIQYPYHGGNNQRFKLIRKWA